MESPQSIVSSFNDSLVREDRQSDFFVPRGRRACADIDMNRSTFSGDKPVGFIGSVHVYVDRARDIHNICIYHKQDVYAKLCLTSDPESVVSTKIINGGGKNPVFDDTLELHVRTVDCSLKCEIWMLSRVRNYMEDQLLGFALVPLSEVLIKNGRIEKEFSLSSTDLFHSPAGFVQLLISYSGESPEVLGIDVPPALSDEMELRAPEVQDPPVMFDKIEFPDPKIMNENQKMVFEYFGMTSPSVDSQNTSESLVTSSDTENSEVSFGFIKGSSTLPNLDSPPSSVSTNGVCLGAQSVTASTDQEGALKPPAKDETESSDSVPRNATAKPLIDFKVVQEPKMMQQDIVDMYMKSMQEFTESLAKMKLPMDTVDIKQPTEGLGDSATEQKLQAAKNTAGSRVFYGSRAFF